MRRLWIPILALTFLVALPQLAHACPVCFDPDDEGRLVFLATTAFLTLFPLSIVGGVGLWLRRRMKQLEDEEDGTE